MKDTPHTTLFMIESLDGKISSGDSDRLDVDQDWKRIVGAREGLHQYYELEKLTDLCSFNTGRVMAKVGINKRSKTENKIPVMFVLVDNEPHINRNGLCYLSGWLKHVFIATTNKNHPAFKNDLENVTPILYKKEVNLTHLFKTLKKKYKIHRVTIQSGGTMNTALLREGLIDQVSVVIAPLLVGGSTTSTLLDGEALHNISELKKIKALKLKKVSQLKNSYLHVVYSVVKDTKLVG